MALLLVVLTPPLVLGAVCIALLGISRSGKHRPSLQRYEHTHAFAHDCWRQAKPAETSVTLSRSSMATTSAEAILQFVLDALHHLTGLPLLMVNQPQHNLPCLNRTNAIETQMRADQKNAELLDSPTRVKERSASSTWSDYEAPEEEMSDLSSDEEEFYKVTEGTSTKTAQNQLFDGLEFYLAVTQSIVTDVGEENVEIETIEEVHGDIEAVDDVVAETALISEEKPTSDNVQAVEITDIVLKCFRWL
ncbi:RxLR effector candidate protein [Phytophthora palmivora]|uniref:RxLR effector candidate protein n=1 Tax=Phytophthora palmivora TaxID=4796 RepID=A0A2P4YDE9_9STRA|nr:RxLR effector candidate protein [Phytophthora palmivora]